MAITIFSDHYNATPGSNALQAGFSPTPGASIDATTGVSHARIRTSVARLTVSATGELIDDQYRFLTLKSGDRLGALRFSTIAAIAGTTLNVKIGVHLAGTAHDGAAVDDDLFDVSQDLLATLARLDVFTNASLVDTQRWLPLWSLAGQSSDPGQNWDITAMILTTPIVTVGGVMMVEADYIAGD